MGISFDADLPVPLLMLHADLRGFYRMLGADPSGPLRSFNDFSYERLEHAGQRADIHRMVLRDSLHSGLTDTPLFMRRPLRDGLFGTAPTQVCRTSWCWPSSITTCADAPMVFRRLSTPATGSGWRPTTTARYASGGWANPRPSAHSRGSASRR